jgi:hypothetical protein
MTLAFALALLAHPLGFFLGLAGFALVGLAAGPGNGLVCPTGVFTNQAAVALQQGAPTPLSASGAVNPHQPGLYYITKAGTAALTLAAPTVGADDNVVIEFISTTAHAHTITTPAAGDIQDGNNSGFNTVMTFNAEKGASCKLRAYQGVWYVEQEVGCALSS